MTEFVATMIALLSAIAAVALLWAAIHGYREWSTKKANEQLQRDLEEATRIRERVKGVGMPRGKW